MTKVRDRIPLKDFQRIIEAVVKADEKLMVEEATRLARRALAKPKPRAKKR